MLLFFILLIFYVVCGYVESSFIRKRCTVSVIRLWNIFLIFPLWFLMSFRSEKVGNDTIVYKHLYEIFSANDLYALLSESESYGNVEPGFVFLSYLFGGILDVNYSVFQIIVSTLICIGFFSFFNKYSNNISFSCFLFIILLSFSRSMNIMRQMLAVSLSLYSFSFLLNKKYLKYIIYVLLLSLFHKTSLILLSIFPFLFIKSSKLKAIIIFFICISIILFLPMIVEGLKYSFREYQYLFNSIYINSNGGAAYINMLIGLSVLYLFKKLVKSNNDVNIFYSKNIWELYLYMSIIIYYFNFYFGLADRVALYFSSIFLVIIPYSFNKKFMRKYNFFPFLFCIGLTFYFFMVLIFRNHWHTSLPYMFIWE